MSDNSIRPIDRALSVTSTSVDRGVMAIKGYSAFPKVPALLEPYHKIVKRHNRTLVGGGAYPSAEMQSVFYRFILGCQDLDHYTICCPS